MTALRGEIEQTPPMYSAKKLSGRKLYELARRGEEVERQPVTVLISKFEMISEPGQPNDEDSTDLAVSVVCSAGTYVRTLAEQLGQKLGVGAHLAALRRTRAGRFQIRDALNLDQLRDLAESNSIDSVMVTADAVFSDLPLIDLDQAGGKRTLNGLDLKIGNREWPAGQLVRMRDESGALIAIGIYDRQRESVHPKVVVASLDSF